MDVLSFFALIVLILLVVLAVYVVVELARWPGRVARERSHPHADAVNVCSWLGILLTAGAAWIIAAVWAHMPPAKEKA
jgi:hypothetical protein